MQPVTSLYIWLPLRRATGPATAFSTRYFNSFWPPRIHFPPRTIMEDVEHSPGCICKCPKCGVFMTANHQQFMNETICTYHLRDNTIGQGFVALAVCHHWRHVHRYSAVFTYLWKCIALNLHHSLWSDFREIMPKAARLDPFCIPVDVDVSPYLGMSEVDCDEEIRAVAIETLGKFIRKGSNTSYPSMYLLEPHFLMCWHHCTSLKLSGSGIFSCPWTGNTHANVLL